MTKDLLVESETATIVEDPDTTPMSVRPPTKDEKILPKEEVEEKRRVFFSSSDYTMYYFSFNQSLFIIN